MIKRIRTKKREDEQKTKTRKTKTRKKRKKKKTSCDHHGTVRKVVAGLPAIVKCGPLCACKAGESGGGRGNVRCTILG